MLKWFIKEKPKAKQKTPKPLLEQKKEMTPEAFLERVRNMFSIPGKSYSWEDDEIGFYFERSTYSCSCYVSLKATKDEVANVSYHRSTDFDEFYDKLTFYPGPWVDYLFTTFLPPKIEKEVQKVKEKEEQSKKDSEAYHLALKNKEEEKKRRIQNREL